MQDFLLGWATPICDLPRVTITTHRVPSKKGFIRDYEMRTQPMACQAQISVLFP